MDTVYSWRTSLFLAPARLDDDGANLSVCATLKSSLQPEGFRVTHRSHQVNFAVEEAAWPVCSLRHIILHQALY